MPTEISFETLSKEVLQHAHLSCAKDAVYFFARSGTGKSLTIASSLGCELHWVQEEEIWHLVVKQCPEGVIPPEVGLDVASKTLWPRVYRNNASTFVDIAGWEDNRPDSIPFLAMLATQFAIHTTETVKSIIIMIPYTDLRDPKFRQFNKTMQIIAELFKKSIGLYKDSIKLVVRLERHLQPSRQEVLLYLQQFHKYAQQELQKEPTLQNHHRNALLSVLLDPDADSHIYLFHPTETREALLADIRQSPGFPARELGLLSEQSVMEKFMAHMDHVVMQGEAVLTTLLNTPAILAALEKKKAELDAWLANDTATASKSTPYTADADLRLIQEALNQTKREINTTKDQLTTLNDTITTLKTSIDTLLKRTELVSFHDFSWKERDFYGNHKGPHSRQENDYCLKIIGQIFGFLIWPIALEYIVCGTRTVIWFNEIVRKITIPPYLTDPFNAVEASYTHDCDHGGEKGHLSHTFNVTTGRYDGGTYTTPSHCNGEVLVQKKRPYCDLPNNQRQLQFWRNNITANQKEITRVNAELTILETQLTQQESQELTVTVRQEQARIEQDSIHTQQRLNMSQAKRLERNQTLAAIQKQGELFNLTQGYFFGNQSIYQMLKTLHQVIGLHSEPYLRFIGRYLAVLKQLHASELDDNVTRCHVPEEDVCFWEEGPNTFGFPGAHAASEALTCFPKPVLPLPFETVWDPVARQDPRTGVPIYQVAFYPPTRPLIAANTEPTPLQPARPFARLGFYGQPGPCRSADGTQNNIVLAEGVSLGMDSMDAICPFRIPHWSDPLFTGMEEGARRGVAKVVSQTLPERAQSCAENILYYGLYFAMMYRTESAYEACFKTLQVAAIALAFTLIHWLAKQTGDSRLEKTTRALTFFVPLGYTGYQQGLRSVWDTFLHMFTTMAIQAGIQRIVHPAPSTTIIPNIPPLQIPEMFETTMRHRS